MKTEGVTRRLLIAGFLAASLIGATYFATRSSAASRTPRADAETAARLPDAPDEVTAALAGPGVVLVYLAAREADVPAQVAPVVAVARGGALRLVRPPPPEAEAEAEAGPWLGAGIVLPVARLADLDAGARAGLLDVLGAFAQGRRLGRSDVVLCRIEGGGDALAALLRWVR